MARSGNFYRGTIGLAVQALIPDFCPLSVITRRTIRVTANDLHHLITRPGHALTHNALYLESHMPHKQGLGHSLVAHRSGNWHWMQALAAWRCFITTRTAPTRR